MLSIIITVTISAAVMWLGFKFLRIAYGDKW